MAARFSVSIAAGLALMALAVGFASCREAEEDTSQLATAPATSTKDAPAPTAPVPTPSQASQTPAPTDESVPDGWISHVDATGKFALFVPQGSVAGERTVDYPEKDGRPAFQGRIISFHSPSGASLLGVLVAPSQGLATKEWIDDYPGWPSQPSETTVDGEPALRFSTNVLGEPTAQIYFQHSGLIYVLSGGVFGDGHSGDPATITESEFQTAIRGFRFMN